MQLEFHLEATVIPFPLARRHRLVRETAVMILATSDDEGARDWKQLIRVLTDPLLAAGVPLEIARKEAREFHDAVQNIMWRSGDHAGGAG